MALVGGEEATTDSALYDKQAGGHLVLYDPLCSGRFEKAGFNSDLLGVAYNWVQPTGVDRDESNFEMFYRFPLFPEFGHDIELPSNRQSSAGSDQRLRFLLLALRFSFRLGRQIDSQVTPEREEDIGSTPNRNQGCRGRSQRQMLVGHVCIRQGSLKKGNANLGVQ